MPSCSCLQSYIGSPPNCRPECSVNSDCLSNQACIREKCQDPCPGSCGILAQCSVNNHVPICTCPEGYTGDPFTNCILQPVARKNFFLNLSLKLSYLCTTNSSIIAVEQRPVDPCSQSPCGSNAICDNGSCTCQENYFGDPFSGCRPECVLNTDCGQNRACLRNKCIDPCPGTCGQNALCNVYNHIPMCTCPTGMSGNAFVSCSPIRGTGKLSITFKQFFYTVVTALKPFSLKQRKDDPTLQVGFPVL